VHKIAKDQTSVTPNPIYFQPTHKVPTGLLSPKCPLATTAPGETPTPDPPSAYDSKLVTLQKLGILIVALALAACASAPDGGHSGKSGTSSSINGVEVWKDGPPSRPYRVIANTGREAADNSSSYADEERSIAQEARQRGADAVIILNAVMVVSRIDETGGRPIFAPKVAAELIKYE
jgi:hypothetical protein